MKVNAENGWAREREREFVLELKRKTEVWSRSGEECGKVFCVEDTHALRNHLRAIVLASLQPSSHNSSECAGPILHWELFRSLAWRHSCSFCRLEVVFCWPSRLLWMSPGELGTAHWPPSSICSFTLAISIGCFCYESSHIWC